MLCSAHTEEDYIISLDAEIQTFQRLQKRKAELEATTDNEKRLC
jgi:hypothetical protein